MVFYYESYPAMLTGTSRHQFGAMGHHYPYGQSQPPASSQFPAAHHQEMPCAMSQFGGAMDAGVPLQSSWHGQAANSSVYSAPSSCSRTPGYDEWSPRSPCAHLGTTGPSCGSPANGAYNAGYKLGGVQDFSQPQQHQPPQDLSIHGGGQQSPDSGLTVSSDGVSSSDSPGGANHVLAGIQQHGAMSAVQQGLRPPIIRSPYDWIKKPSYQTQCNPGK
uniref:Uncharacterized protein n=1 Tax=Strigamia maritima TaxID=126957 RepID=T1IX03_STRMM